MFVVLNLDPKTEGECEDGNTLADSGSFAARIK
jgi:hypothetical protein